MTSQPEWGLRVLIVVVATLLACTEDRKERLDSFARSLGLVDEPPLPPVAIDVLCNPNAGNVCTRDTATTTINAAVDFIAVRPGSSLRFWVLGNQATDTRPIGTVTSPAAPEGSERVVRARRAQFISNTRAYFSLLLDPVFREERMHRTPLAESLTQIALATTGSLPRRVVVLSDVYEESFVGDFECLLPTSAIFQARLQRRRLLVPGSLTNARIYFAFVGANVQGYRRCMPALSRELGARDLWRVALGRAGAEVRFDTELTAFNPEPQQHDR